MAANPDDARKLQDGSFEKEQAREEEEEEELEADFAVPGVANSEMEHRAEAARLKLGTKQLSAEALAELTQPWGISRYVSGGDDDDSPKRKRGDKDADEEESEALGLLDAPLWHGILAAPPPPARPSGFPPGSKWVKSA